MVYYNSTMELIFFSNKPYFISADYDHAKIPNLYLDWISKLAVTTARNYAYALNRWLQWCHKHRLDWSKVTPDDILAYRDTLQGDRRSLNYELDRLVAFYDFAAGHGVASPMTRLLDPRNILRVRGRSFQKPFHPYTVEEVGEFIRGFVKVRDRLMAELMFLWGLRRCEVLSLPRSLLQLPVEADGVSFVVTGKGGSQREIKLDVETRNRLVEYAKTTTGTLIFTHRGRPLHPETVTKAFAANSRRTGLTFHPHLLRHMYASHRIPHLDAAMKTSGKGMNASLTALQSELGHKNASTTERYVHILDTQVASKNLDEWHRDTKRVLKGGAA